MHTSGTMSSHAPKLCTLLNQMQSIFANSVHSQTTINSSSEIVRTSGTNSTYFLKLCTLLDQRQSIFGNGEHFWTDTNPFPQIVYTYGPTSTRFQKSCTTPDQRKHMFEHSIHVSRNKITHASHKSCILQTSRYRAMISNMCLLLFASAYCFHTWTDCASEVYTNSEHGLTLVQKCTLSTRLEWLWSQSIQ